MTFNILKIIDKDHYRENLNEYTRKAFIKLPVMDKPKILDVGCGTGVPTLELAHISDGEILALDIDQEALNCLDEKIRASGFVDQVKTVNSSLFDMDFPSGSFDLIWAEGSLFEIGFEEALRDWRHLIRDHGFMVLHIPHQDHQARISSIKASGYRLLDFFLVHHSIWWSYFYQPYEEHVKNLIGKYQENKEVLKVLKIEEAEIEMFKKNPEDNSSIFYIIQKV
jgi:ubiquinone/menaquinone biosynthesis C-methylase UbiE